MNAGQTHGDAADHASPAPPIKSARPGSRRRRWLLAIALLLFCVATGATALWIYQGPKYTAVALLHIASREPWLLFQTSDQAREDDFEVYKNTQREVLSSRFVLTAALRKPDAAKLRVVQRELDPVDWLQRELKVEFPLDAEIMRISLTADDPKEASILVNAVVEAYMDEVVDDEESQRSARLSELDTIYSEKEMEVRKKRTDLRQLAEQLGAGDSTGLSLKQQIALEEFADVRKELTRVRFDLRRTEGQLKMRMQEAMLDGATDVEVSEIELNAATQSDPVAGRLLFELLFQWSQMLDKRIASIRAVAPAPNEARQLEEMAQAIDAIQQQLDLRRATLREELQQAGCKAAEVEIKRLECQIAVLKEQEQQLARDLEQLREKAEEVSGSSIDIEMMRAEIQHIDEVLSSVAEERERLKVELRSQSRVTQLQAAEAPKLRD